MRGDAKLKKFSKIFQKTNKLIKCVAYKDYENDKKLNK